MKRRRFGLQARFVLALLFALLMVLALLALLLMRQGEMQREASLLGRAAVHAMATDSLVRRGESITRQLADSLANPLYYADLDAMGDVLHNVARQPDVAYVLVYDERGRVVHDGSREVASWGEQMQDPLARAAINAPGLRVQWSEQVMDISHPISLGGERLGGVRVGYALDEMLRVEQGAASVLEERLAQMGRRHAGWLAIVLVALVAVGVVMAWFIQRMLVAPIRQLAEAARAVGAGDYEDKPLSSSRRNDELGELVRAFSEMRDSIARHDRAVHHIAYTDALTGLSNRLAFREELDRRLSGLAGGGQQLALLFADVDDFKRINDTMGHEAGDAVLSLFAVRIREAVDAEIGDAGQPLVARFGGDEFVMLLQGDDVPGAAVRLGTRLLGELRKPLLVHGREVVMSTSVGITVSPDDAADASTLMKNGDIAMYQAKAAGKNCFRFYSREMDLAVERRAYLEQELHGAWERGELSLQYQPLHRFSDQKLVGAEALLRWHHPKLGLVPPAVFIEVAENSGLIEQLGVQVLRSACGTMAGWNERRAGRQAERLFVSVNVSPRQLRTNDLPAEVASVLADTRLDPESLHLELTETAVIGDEEHAGGLLAQLRLTGVKVWLDDFGTGFSGLSHLRRVPVDGVKIDRSFITDLLRDPDDLALTSAIISMAHSLNIIVVAEGVENAGQVELLRSHGCDLGQGHWLGYPMDPGEFARLLD